MGKRIIFECMATEQALLILLPWNVQNDPARTGAEVITLDAVGAVPTIQPVAGPNTARTFTMTVVLPNAEVAHFGGAETSIEFSDATAVLTTVM